MEKMLSEIRSHYIKDRVKTVDQDFLMFEETQTSKEDMELLLKVLSGPGMVRGKLPNPYNSILLYVTGLTDLFDYQKGRSDTIGGAPPDIDMDFSALDADKATEWLVDHWGRENVANVMARGTFKPKSIVKKYYTATEESKSELETLLKMIPKAKFGKESSLDEILKVSPGFADVNPTFFTSAEKIEDMVSHFSIHASGIVITDKPVAEYVPIWSNKTAERITQFDKDELEELGILKFDLLKVDILSILKEACRLIKLNDSKDIDIYELEDGDKAAYAVLTEGLFSGVFQMEGPGANIARKMFKEIEPTNIEMISAVSSLNRPGPRSSGLDVQYVRNRKNGYPPEDMSPRVAEILEGTFWTLTYQEQVMKLVSVLAGFSLKDADEVRRSLGKKKKEVLEPYKAQFLQGCDDRGFISNTSAIELWETLLRMSDYCFCAAHGLAYSYLTYVTAYLKANYPVEFFCALMTVRSITLQPKDWEVKAPRYVAEAKFFGVEVSPPSINSSEIGFTIRGKEIFFGLSGIRDVGVTATRTIISARKQTPFKSVMDFLSRVNLQKMTVKVFNALIEAGAFDRLGYDRGCLLANAQLLIDFVRDTVTYQEKLLAVAQRERELETLLPLLDQRDILKRQLKKLGETPLSPDELDLLATYGDMRRPVHLKPPTPPTEPSAPEETRSKRVTVTLSQVMKQGHMIGCWLGTHPVDMLGLKGFLMEDIEEDASIGEELQLYGVVSSMKKINTRGGEQMAFIELSDSTSTVEISISPELLRKNQIEVGIILSAVVRVREKDPVKFYVKRLSVINTDG